jgi:NitT/TauT family transport system permease protein
MATLSALVAGLVLGVLPPVRATLGPLVTGIAVIPPIALLPVLFIALGLGETAKVALIVVGIAPPMIRDITDMSPACRANRSSRRRRWAPAVGRS